MNDLAVQTAIYTRLTTYAPLLAIKTYDHVPQNAVFPYNVIGEGTSGQWDTDDSVGSDATVTIHTWSQYRGRKQVKEIQKLIYDALHRYELPVAGSNTITVEWEYADTMLDPDGLTRHGVTRFRIITEKD